VEQVEAGYEPEPDAEPDVAEQLVREVGVQVGKASLPMAGAQSSDRRLSQRWRSIWQAANWLTFFGGFSAKDNKISSV